MDEHERSLQVMDDDGAGSAITSIPAHVAGLKPGSVDSVSAGQGDRLWICPCGCGSAARLDARAGWVPAKPEDATSRIARERQAIRTVLARKYEQASRYARFEQGTAGAWLGTYSS